ncbi:MAG: FAD-dependent oxidoreductase [Gemmatimonadota bacterium]|nr:FAD-dependent oxidoreductase [Gemmatimonadota bacterium]
MRRVDVTTDDRSGGPPHVLVAGAGIAGIAAALRLRALSPACRITLVDAAVRLGGKIDGEIVAGCVVDGGADVCIGPKLRSTHMFADLALGERLVRVNPNGLRTYEKRDGALVPAATQVQEELVTFPGGMRELVDAACAGLHDVTVVTNTAVEKLAREGAVWKAEAGSVSYTADAVILALPASSAAHLLAGIVEAEARDLCTLEYPATTTVTMAWQASDVPRPLDGTGYLVTDPSAVVTACTWTSSKIPSHATAGIVLVRGYVRGDAAAASAAVFAELTSVLGVTERPLFTRMYEWPGGIPVYTSAHEANVHALTDVLAPIQSIFVAGSAFHGVGIPDCIASGERAAEGAAAYLTGHTDTIES